MQNLISLTETQAGQAAHLDQALWRQLQEAPSFEAFAQAWLIVQCALIDGARRGVVVFGSAEAGPYAPIAFFPEGKPGSLGLLSATDLAIQERRGVLRDPSYSGAEAERGRAACHIAYPLLVDARLHGAVAIELAPRAEHELRATMRSLQWGIAGIEARLRRQEGGRFAPANKRLAWVLDLASAGVEQERFQAAATAVVTKLATILGCERVSLGFSRGGRTTVSVVSHSAQFAQRSNLVEGIGAVMDEAVDQRATLVYSGAEDSPAHTLHYHAGFSKAHGGCALCTVPLTHGGEIIGALALERPGDVGFDAQTIEFCESVAALVGPILHFRRREDRWLIAKIWDACGDFARHLLGPGHAWLKAASILLTATAAFMAFATGEYRIAANTRVEGLVQRVVSSPIGGYIKAARVRGGDLVRKDELMAQLDDRDLLLERAKWTSQRQQHLQEYREALAKSSRSEIAVLQAQLGQAEAELAAVEAKLARIQIVAPFDGVIVSGDLSQSLGAPVAQGDILFKVAPLDAYRVILEVDERDMTAVQAGQTGKLVLTGKTDAVLPFRVDKINLVSEAREGRNFFQVEAKLDHTPDFLRPGMKGVGKIEIGERRLIWIWTHTLTDWLRLALWSYWR